MNSTLSEKAMINPTIVGCSGKSSLKTFRPCWRPMKRNQLTLKHEVLPSLALLFAAVHVAFYCAGLCDCVRADVCVFEITLLRVTRCECELVSLGSVRRALGRVPMRARGRHGLSGVGLYDPREFKGDLYHERLSMNSFALTRVRLV